METRRRRGLAAPLILAVVAVFGLSMASAILVTAPHAASTENARTNAPAGLAAGFTAFLHPNPGVYASKITKENSENWAGYGDVAKTSGTITDVFAEWFVPTVTCNEHSGVTYQAQWVGIDGLVNGNVSQVGSLAYCSGPGATPAYYTWYEFYPYESVVLVADSSANAFITAYVDYNPTVAVDGSTGIYTLELDDLSNAVNFVVTGGGWVCGATGCEGGPDQSAECISEAVTLDNSFANLSDYKSTTFYACHDTIGTHTTGIGDQGSGTAIYRLNQLGASEKTDQKTGSLSSSEFADDTFTITWEHSN